MKRRFKERNFRSQKREKKTKKEKTVSNTNRFSYAKPNYHIISYQLQLYNSSAKIMFHFRLKKIAFLWRLSNKIPIIKCLWTIVIYIEFKLGLFTDKYDMPSINKIWIIWYLSPHQYRGISVFKNLKKMQYEIRDISA